MLLRCCGDIIEMRYPILTPLGTLQSPLSLSHVQGSCRATRMGTEAAHSIRFRRQRSIQPEGVSRTVPLCGVLIMGMPIGG